MKATLTVTPDGWTWEFTTADGAKLKWPTARTGAHEFLEEQPPKGAPEDLIEAMEAQYPQDVCQVLKQLAEDKQEAA